MIKSWIKTDSERGLQRALLIANELALHGHNRIHNEHDKEPSQVSIRNGDDTGEIGPTVFERIARWGASLLRSGNSSDGDEIASHERSRSKSIPVQTPRTQIQSDSAASQSTYAASNRGSNRIPQIYYGVGMANRLSYLYSAGDERNRNRNSDARARQTFPHENKQESKTLRNSPVKDHTPFDYPQKQNKFDEEQHDTPEPIGPLPYMETNVAPDLKTFLLVVQGKFTC